MAADVIAKFKADVTNYDAGLAKANKKLSDFVKQNTTLNGIMGQGVSMLTKFAGGFAAAQVAMKTFNAIIMDGSQTTGDFVRNGLGALNDTMGVLASSIATFDWTPFEDGLLRTFQRAKELREEMDLLWNLQTARDIVSSDAMERVRAAQTAATNPNATDEQRQSALKAAQDAISDLEKANNNVIKSTESVISKQAGLYSGMEANANEVIQAFKNIAINGESAISLYKDAGKVLTDYDSKINQLQKANKNTVGAVGAYIEVDTHRYDDEINALKKERDEYVKLHRENLIGYAVAEKYNDEQFKADVARIQNISSIRSETERLQRLLNTTTTRVNRPTSARTAISATSGISSSMEMTGWNTTPTSYIDNGVKSMRDLNNEAKSLKTILETTTDADAFGKVMTRYEEVQKMIELQPLALEAGLSIDEERIKQQLNDLGDNLRLEMKVSIKETDENIESFSKGGKTIKGDWKEIAANISQAGSAMNQLDNKGLNIAGTIMQAVANVALGFAAAMASPATTATGVFGWIAAAAAGLATMTATIASIKSQTSGSFASGGIVPGFPNGGRDSTFVYASPGELILNRAQQENILQQLGGDLENGGNVVTFVLKGEQMEALMNNYGRRTGKGKLVYR